MGLVTLMMMIKSNVKGRDFIQNASGISQDGVVLCVLVLASLFSFGTSNSQGNALLELKASLKAVQLTNWYPSRPNPCQWTFVGCDDEYNVISLSMISMGFSGTLSPHIGALRTLTVLELQGNNITGGIPKELQNLTSLTTLKLENNCLTGDIPSSIGNLTKLKILSLSQNNLSGNIPDSISNLQNLENIELAFNNLSGRIPDHLFQIHMYNFTGNNLNCGTNFSRPCASNASVASVAFIPGIPHKSKNGVVFGSIGGLISILPCGGVLFLLWKKAKKGQAFVDVSGEDVCRIELGQLKRFSWRELQLATDDFNEKNVLGQGGFGKVYRGVLADGTKIAVKQMTSNGRPNEEESFLREIEMISVANHKNLLRLIGYCTTTSERLLVYPLMKNGSVASCLRGFRPGDPVLHWCIRKQVALGTAQGLEYLHKHCNPKIIHRDVKAANILLDENFEAVVADFGLAQLVDVRKNSVTTKVRGTMGHIAPEYFSTGKSSEKTDVFGYGVMLLELVTGQRAIDFSFLEKEDDLLLLDHVKKMERVNRLDAVIDRNLDQSYNWHEVEMIIQIALLCTQSRPEERPTMSEVVCFLEGKDLAERWQEQQQVEMNRRHERETIQQRFNWHEDSCEGSMCNLEAMELSGGR